MVHKKAGTLSILIGPLDGAYSNRHSCLYAQCHKALIHTKLELSICCKKLSRFPIKDELPFALGISRPSGTTKIGK